MFTGTFPALVEESHSQSCNNLGNWCQVPHIRSVSNNHFQIAQREDQIIQTVGAINT